MKFVFYTYDGHGLPIAFKLQQEGYDVIVAQAKDLDYMPKEEPEIKRRRLMLYDGLLEKHDADRLTEKLLKEPNKDEFFIFCDFNYLWKYAEQLKRAGFKGLLPSKEDFEFEENRQKAKEFVRQNYDIFAEEETQEFDTVEEAKEFLKQRTDKIWGVKGFNPEAPTFFPWSNDVKIAHEELIDVLEKNKKLYESEGFILEEKIEDLIEFTPEVITFDKEILGMNIDIELKAFGPGNTAFQVGDSVSMIFWLNEEDWEQFLLSFFPVTELYLRENEMVVWDAGVMYSPSRKAYYFTEFCANREGWNSVFSKLATFPYVGQYFERIANKERLYDENVMPFGCSIRVFNEIRDEKDKKLIVQDALIHADLNCKNVWLWDVYKSGEKLYTVGYDHNLAVITWASGDWKEAFKTIEALIKSGKIFNYSLAYYRTASDILSEDYWGNITQRYNWLVENILQNPPKIEPFKDIERLIFYENAFRRLRSEFSDLNNELAPENQSETSEEEEQ